jgi:chromosome segregation ATPase
MLRAYSKFLLLSAAFAQLNSLTNDIETTDANIAKNQASIALLNSDNPAQAVQIGNYNNIIASLQAQKTKLQTRKTAAQTKWDGMQATYLELMVTLSATLSDTAANEARIKDKADFEASALGVALAEKFPA